MKTRLVDLNPHQRAIALSTHKPTSEPYERHLDAKPGMFESWPEFFQAALVLAVTVGAVALVIAAVTGALDDITPFTK